MYESINTCTSISITFRGVIAYVYGIQGRRIYLFSMAFRPCVVIRIRDELNNGILAKIPYTRVSDLGRRPRADQEWDAGVHIGNAARDSRW
jgi:hypothetical protein